MRQQDSDIATEAKPKQGMRALALDALRGIAILAMCLSGRVPFGELALPAWMYHAQNPPPHGRLDTSVAGYTWVDLVFPMFLFAMGVAFPFAFTSRLAKGLSKLQLSFSALVRGLILVAFAIYVEHIRPWALDPAATTKAFYDLFGLQQGDDSDFSRWMLAFVGFLLLFPVLTRFPKQWSATLCWGIRSTGLFAIVIFLSILRYPDGANGTFFNVNRSDIILLVLANMAFFASVIWLYTMNSIGLRLCFLWVGIVAHLTAYNKLHVINALEWTPAPWIYRLLFLKYLCIVIPGTIIGDMLLAWMKEDRETALSTGWSRGKMLALSVGLFALVVAIHAGLQGRWVPGTIVITAAASAALWAAMRETTACGGVFLRRLFLWGTLWLLIGLIVEPLEGGIKKSPSNLSYYFTSLGLSIHVLFSLTVWIDILGARRWFAPLIANGQNPMLAYVGINNLMAPFFELPAISEFGKRFFTSSAWMAGTWAFIKTAVLALMTWGFTKARIYWRS